MVKRPLSKKVLREIVHNFKQYISVILITVLAVTLFTGIIANWKNLEYKVNKVYDNSNALSGVVMLNGTDKANLTEIITYLNDNKIDYETRLYLPAELNGNNAYLIVVPDNSEISRPLDNNGNKIEISNDKVYVDSSYINNLLEENTLSFTLNDIKFNKINTVGMIHPESLVKSNASPMVYMTKTCFDNYLPPDFINNYIANMVTQIVFPNNLSNINTILNDIKTKFSSYIAYATTRTNMQSNSGIDTDINQAENLLYIFPVIFYIVAVLIIIVSISQLINRERKNIGLLKALGYSKIEILKHYTDVFIVLGIIGSLIGIIIGPILIPRIMGAKYNILYMLPTYKLPVTRLIYFSSLLIILVTVIITSIFVTLSSLKKVPADSLRGESSYKIKNTLFDKIPAFKNKMLSIHMAFRNMKRKISRTIMVIVGVLGCSALLLSGFGIDNTLEYSINQERVNLKYDLNAQYISTPVQNIADVTYDNYYIEQVNLINSNNKVYTTYLYVISDNSPSFAFLTENDNVYVSQKVDDELNIKKNKDITLSNYKNNYSIQVNTIANLAFTSGIFIKESYYKILFNQPSFSLTTNATSAFITINPDSGKTIDEVKTELEATNVFSGIVTRQSINDRIDNSLATIKRMTITLKIFAILLAVVVIYNLALLNFEERIKDIATLKVLGFNQAEIGLSSVFEVLFLSIVSIIIGLFLGYPLTKLILMINENVVLAYIYHINVSSYIYTILITVLSTIIINLYTSLSIRKVKMVESLKSVE